METQIKQSKLVPTLAGLIILSIIIEGISTLFSIPVKSKIPIDINFFTFINSINILSIIDLIISCSYCLLFFFLLYKGGSDKNSKYYMNWWITSLLIINVLAYILLN